MNKKTWTFDCYSAPESTVVEVGFEGILCGSTEGSTDGSTDNFDEIDNPYFG